MAKPVNPPSMQQIVWAVLNPWISSCSRIIVAYSGGKDSHVLLHLLSRIRHQYSIALEAWHVNHGLSPNAGYWTEHCATTCQDLEVGFKRFSVTIAVRSKHSLEELARNARYQIFKKNMHSDDILLTAHTQNDQAETILMHLSRGSGLLGLGGIPRHAVWPKGQILRPMLDIARETISEYAYANQLNWIEDESNQDTRFLRNAVRHQILPKLKTLNPGIINNLARSAKLCLEAQNLLAEYLQPELQNILTVNNEVNVSLLKKTAGQSPVKIRQLFRLWFKQNNCSLPSEKKLDEICAQMLRAKSDNCPAVSWGEHTIRRYQGLLSIQVSAKQNDLLEIKPEKRLWSLDEILELNQQNRWIATPMLGEGIHIVGSAKPKFAVIFRYPGMRCRILGEVLTRKIKQIFQDLKIPPWERGTTPLFFYAGCLIAVGEHIVSVKIKNADPAAFGWVLHKCQSSV